jgi:hypothetical protein
MNFNLRTALGSIAPTIATMWGGPLAGTAITALEGVFGLSPAQGGADGVTAAVAAGMTPENIAAIRAADQKHLEVLQQQGIDLDKLNDDFVTSMATIDANDRGSARERETKVGGYTTPALAWLVVSASMALGAAVVTGNTTKDPALAGTVGLVMGYIFSEAKAVLAYYFGSSAGSARKDDTIQAQAKAAAAP